MLLCKIHNLTTGSRFEFQAADQAAIDAKLASEPSYGREAWTETIPAWTETMVSWVDPDGTTHDGIRYVEHPEQVIEHPSERTIEVVEVDQRPERLARAWAAANQHAQQMDENSRTSLLWLAVDPDCPAWRRERILAVQAWWATIWEQYAMAKSTIEAGHDASFDASAVGDCPFTIWQIANP
jgi:hypothetical protein